MENFRELTGIWVCVPRDWDEVHSIRVIVSGAEITATYYYINGLQESEKYTYRVVSARNGMISVSGAPFSFLQFNSGKQLMISRLHDGIKRPFTYIFSLYMEKPDFITAVPQARSYNRTI